LEKLDALPPSRAFLLSQTEGTADKIASNRAITVAQLRRRLRGDLDAIAQTAMHRELDRRYASVDQLSQDIERHLAAFPITARADWSYRAAKYVRRNAWAVTGVLLLFAALIAAALLGYTKRRETERRLATVVAYSQSAQKDVLDGIQDLPG